MIDENAPTDAYCAAFGQALVKSYMRDKALADAEQKIREIRASGGDVRESDAIGMINSTAPRTWRGVAVKLRLLCDQKLGVRDKVDEDELVALQQVLKFAEREEQQQATMIEALKEEFVTRGMVWRE
jgi:hypothetical protein